MSKPPVALTPKSTKLLESQCFLVGRSEHWLAFQGDTKGGVRQDLFGFIDLLALGPKKFDFCVPNHGEVLAVQVTSRVNISSRVKKIKESKYLERVLEVGWKVVVHGWYKDDNGRWQVQIREVI